MIKVGLSKYNTEEETNYTSTHPIINNSETLRTSSERFRLLLEFVYKQIDRYQKKPKIYPMD